MRMRSSLTDKKIRESIITLEANAGLLLDCTEELRAEETISQPSFILNCNPDATFDSDLIQPMEPRKKLSVSTSAPLVRDSHPSQISRTDFKSSSVVELPETTPVELMPVLSSMGDVVDNSLSTTYQQRSRNKFYNPHRWSTANWTSIFLHFHSVEKTQHLGLHICMAIFGFIAILAIFTIELIILPSKALLFTRLCDWTLLTVFVYIMCNLIAYSKYSNNKWLAARDNLYVISVVLSVICILWLIAMYIPSLITHQSIHRSQFAYIDCETNDDYCKGELRPTETYETGVIILICVSHCFSAFYCIANATFSIHRFAFEERRSQSLICIALLLLWFCWVCASFGLTHHWPYRIFETLICSDEHTLKRIVLNIFVIVSGIILIALLVYIFAYWLHHYLCYFDCGVYMCTFGCGKVCCNPNDSNASISSIRRRNTVNNAMMDEQYYQLKHKGEQTLAMTQKLKELRSMPMRDDTEHQIAFPQL